jgi:hypothetical protein
MFETKAQGIKAKQENEGILTELTVKVDFESFDVFLAHNNQDKPTIEAIAQELTRRNLKPWLDKWHLPPGKRFAEEIERVLPETKSVAIFVGKDGLGPWQDQEMYAILDLFVKNKRPVIPVLLPDIKEAPELPLFLRPFNWVRFATIDDREALDRLEWGITGQHPREHVVTDNLVNEVTAAYELLVEITEDVFQARPAGTVPAILGPDELRVSVRRLDLADQITETDMIKSLVAPLRQYMNNWNALRAEEAKPRVSHTVKLALKQVRENEERALRDKSSLLKQQLEELTGQAIELPELE